MASDKAIAELLEGIDEKLFDDLADIYDENPNAVAEMLRETVHEFRRRKEQIRRVRATVDANRVAT